MSKRLLHFSPSETEKSISLPGLRPGVLLITSGDEAELRDNSLGQVIKLGEAAAVIVGLLDGEHDAASVLQQAGESLGGQLDPMGLVDLLQALDQRALLDTPRARAIVSQGLIRADVACLRRLSQRSRAIHRYDSGGDSEPAQARMVPGSRFTCNSCTRCCTDKHLLGPVSAEEVEKITEGFKAIGKGHSRGGVDFLPLPNEGDDPVSFLLRTHNGRCTFLQEDGLCGIHEELGIEFKPSVCRLFPFRPVRRPGGWDVGLSLACPTVANGTGADALPEALEIIKALAPSSPLLQVVSETVQLEAGCQVSFKVYNAWEEEALATLKDSPSQPAQAWLKVVASFETMVSEHRDPQYRDLWLEAEDGVDTETVKLSETADDDGMVSGRGMGELNPDVGRAADVLLRDLATWLELLVGLEAADPMALRRVRNGLVRLRSELAVTPNAPAVLADRSRVARVTASALSTLKHSDADTSKMTVASTTRPSIQPIKLPSENSDALQQLFLTQALMEKSLLRFSAVRQGLLSLTLHLGLLRLEYSKLDPLAPDVADITYMFQHAQFTDVTDSRAVVRHHRDDGYLHKTLLGMSITD